MDIDEPGSPVDHGEPVLEHEPYCDGYACAACSPMADTPSPDITTLAGLTAEIERLKRRLAALEPCPQSPWRDPHRWREPRQGELNDAVCRLCGLVRDA